MKFSVIKPSLVLAGVVGLSGCSSLQNLGEQINSLGSQLQSQLDVHGNSDVVYRAPDVTKNAIFVLGSTWSQMSSHLEAVKDKQSGAIQHQAVVAVTYNLQGQFKQLRHYRWSNVEISSSSALQVIVIQDVQDAPVTSNSLSECGSVCRQETVTVPIDASVLHKADHDLLVQVHAGRDSNNVPLHQAIAKFTPEYVAKFLRESASKQVVAESKQ